MPIRSFRQTLPRYEELLAELAAELRDPQERADDQHPLILVDTIRQTGTQHVYVVWTKWPHLSSQRERSELIMEAYEKAKGVQDALKVVSAMGLTPDEARRMNIEL